MLFLRTGLPGAGKTLNAIREIDLEHQPDPENPSLRFHKDPDHPDLPPRTIYYYGIPDLKADRLKSKWVEFDTPETWFDLPDGSVIVIDEAQRIFGNDGTRARPEKVTRFETHRHQGLDIHLITQHPSLLATAVRKLVGKHINFIRPYGREKGIFRHEYEFCIDNPEKRANFKMAQEEKVTLDKDYFGTYKSSTIHTHKPTRPSYLKTVPLLIAFVLACVLVLIGLGYYIIKEARADLPVSPPENAPVSLPGNAVPRPSQALQSRPDEPKGTDEYIADRSPRIATLPASAPRYDDVAKPRDFPRLVCTSSTDPVIVDRFRNRGRVAVIDGQETACLCHTQQGTRVATDVQFCVDAVTNGIFDDTKLQPQVASGSSPNGLLSGSTAQPAAMQRGRAAASQPAGIAVPGPRVTIVSDNSRDGRPLTRAN